MTEKKQPETKIQTRKDEHLRICLEEDVRSETTTGFERYRLIPAAAREADYLTFSLRTGFLGKAIAAPLLISSMTGGTERGAEINRNLCLAAEWMRIPLALGSLRVYTETNDWRGLADIRLSAPTAPVLANFGAVQLNYGMTVGAIREVVELIRADGLILHFNPLQELIQLGGDTNFSGLMAKIAELRKEIAIPLIAKEVGFGFDVRTAGRLIDAGFDWIDVAGAGGTSWAKVEIAARGERLDDSVYAPFRDFGLPTAEAVRRIHAAFPNMPLIASGGIRTGVDMRKAELLGARMFGVAMPFLRPALEGPEAVCRLVERLVTQYKTARFVSSGIEPAGDSNEGRADHERGVYFED